MNCTVLQQCPPPPSLLGTLQWNGWEVQISLRYTLLCPWLCALLPGQSRFAVGFIPIPLREWDPAYLVCVIPFICSSRVPALPSEWEVWPAQQTIQQVPQWWLIIMMLALYPGLLTCPVAFVACCGKTHHIQWCTLPSNFCAAVGWLLNPRSIAKAVLCGPLSCSVVHASRECATAPNAYLKSKYCM